MEYWNYSKIKCNSVANEILREKGKEENSFPFSLKISLATVIGKCYSFFKLLDILDNPVDVLSGVRINTRKRSTSFTPGNNTNLCNVKVGINIII